MAEPITALAAAQAGQAAIGGIQQVANLFQGKRGKQKQDERQLRQDKALGEQALDRNKRAADYEQELKLKMWKDTNYGAQLAEAEKAGVSKAAVLGGSGAGVGQGASVNGVSGTGAADAAATQQADTQSRLVNAQIGNIEADTNLKRSQTENTGQDTANKELDTQWKKLDVELKGRSLEAQLEMINGELKKQLNEIAIGKDEVGQRLNTYTQRISERKNMAIQVGLQNTAIAQGVRLDEAKVKQIANDMVMRNKELEAQYKGQEVSKENVETMAETMLISAGIQATGQVLKGFTDLLMMKKGQKFKAEEAAKDRKFQGRTQTETVDRYDSKGNYTGGYDKRRR